jgi:hypothetical protein
MLLTIDNNKIVEYDADDKIVTMKKLTITLKMMMIVMSMMMIHCIVNF